MIRLFFRQKRLIFSLFALIGLFVWGSYQGSIRGGLDFSVFYQAWQLVLSGHGNDIYRVSPDRYLYAPSFAWLFSFLSLFPKRHAFFFWSLLKFIFVLIALIDFHQLMERTHKIVLPLWITFGGVLWVARPLLIDIEYGQVNLFIVSVSLSALCRHFEGKTHGIKDFIRWWLLGSFAIAKIFALPLLVVPWIVTRSISKRKLWIERSAVVSAIIFALFVPVFQLGLTETLELFFQWKSALLSRGLPLESHNQSFPALLHHYLSGQATEVRSEGPRMIVFGIQWLTPAQIYYLSLSWTFSFLCLITAWILSYLSHSKTKWISVLLGLLIIPSHLIWKPYFVMSLPLSILLAHQKMRQSNVFSKVSLLFFFFGINFTGFDFVGHSLGAQFESASLLLLLHLLLIGVILASPLF